MARTDRLVSIVIYGAHGKANTHMCCDVDKYLSRDVGVYLLLLCFPYTVLIDKARKHLPTTSRKGGLAFS